MANFFDSLFYANVVSNLLVVLVIAGLIVAIRGAGRQPIWAEAYRRLRRSVRAMAAIVVILLFGAVAVADSLGWQSDSNSPRLSLLDRTFQARFHGEHERTYSPPLATETVGEPHPHKLLYPHQHLLGTDATGSDVVYETMRGCRTAFIVGGLTQLIATPLALCFGMTAGYYGRRIDDTVQYVYTVLDSIPGILLLIALVLVMGRSLTSICVALGVTSWVGLCRLARGETLKHREREYVRAAKALGVGDARILLRHILPNLLPIVIITVTLAASGQILSESILSYLGVGMPPDAGSWGNMVDAARQELTREPMIWWNLLSAAGALFTLVLSLNILGDALRDAVDPRLRSS